MDFTFNGKPIFPTKEAMDELSDVGLDLHDAIAIMQEGFVVRKRKRNIIERAIKRGNKIINIVAVDMGNYYKLIHAGKFSYNKKFNKGEGKDGL